MFDSSFAASAEEICRHLTSQARHQRLLDLLESILLDEARGGFAELETAFVRYDPLFQLSDDPCVIMRYQALKNRTSVGIAFERQHGAGTLFFRDHELNKTLIDTGMLDASHLPAQTEASNEFWANYRFRLL